MTVVPPIDDEQERRVRSAVGAFIHRAGDYFDRSFKAIPVVFDLPGRAAGMYRFHGDDRRIRFNPYLFSKYFEDSLAVTVPHEVAHYITDCVYGLKTIRPHGIEWKDLMRHFGADTNRTCNYDLTGIPVRRQNHYAYECGCTKYAFTARRHYKVLRGTARYQCRQCGQDIAEITAGR